MCSVGGCGCAVWEGVSVQCGRVWVCSVGGCGCDTYQSSLRWQNFSVFVCLSNNRSTTSGLCLQREMEGREGGKERGEGGRWREGRGGREGDGGEGGREGGRWREGGEDIARKTEGRCKNTSLLVPLSVLHVFLCNTLQHQIPVQVM